MFAVGINILLTLPYSCAFQLPNVKQFIPYIIIIVIIIIIIYIYLFIYVYPVFKALLASPFVGWLRCSPLALGQSHQWRWR